MPVFQQSFVLSTRKQIELVEISEQVSSVVKTAGVSTGQCFVFIPHATAGIIINEGADENIRNDFLRCLQQLVPEHGGWLHDQVDNNAAAHLKSSLLGSSVSIPIQNGSLMLGTWQNIFFCEFDGPRPHRTVIVSILS